MKKLTKIALLFSLIISPLSYADEGSSDLEGTTCADAKAMENIIKNTCWDCIFPIYLAGAKIGSSKNESSSGGVGSSGEGCEYCSSGGNSTTPSDNAGQVDNENTEDPKHSVFSFTGVFHNAGVPDDAYAKPLCNCQEGALKKPGVTQSMWEPARLMEFPYQAGCFPALSGAYMSGAFDYLDRGTTGEAHSVSNHTEIDNYQEFRYAHLYAFPILQMMNMMSSVICSKDAYVDFDLMEMTEVNPFWHDKGLSAYTQPEVLLVTAMNIASETACLAETAKTTFNNSPMESLFWCAGNWGGFYPLVGDVYGSGQVRGSSMMLIRSLAMLHREGREFGTVGKKNLCGAKVTEKLPKQQWKVQHYFPRVENGTHVFGFPFIAWEYALNYPTGRGETPGYLLFRWNDCCNTEVVEEALK